MKKIKHSKVKNTGVLFELLVRQITLEVLNGDKTENAKRIVKEFFAAGKELNKELRLYDLLIKEKYSSESRAEKFVDTVCEAYAKLDTNKLNKEKYNLIKQIKESFDSEQFLSSPITNYKVLASIYKVFESQKTQNLDIKDIFNSKITLIENITSKPVSKIIKKDDEAEQLVEMYKKQDKDIRLLTYKILVETFNKKYTNLDSKQKEVLREYINNINNTSKFKDYFTQELKNTILELNKVNKQVSDKVTNIKLNETLSVLKSQKLGRSVADNQVSVLLLSQELLKELKSKVNNGK
jgi:hypothetical protein